MEVQRNKHISPSSLLGETTKVPSEKEKSALEFKTTSEDVPVIDLSNPDEGFLARTVVKVCQEWGIFKVVNHGVPTELIRRLKEVGTEFFELPETEKEVVGRPADSVNIEGYNTNAYNNKEGVKVWADHLFHTLWPPSRINYKFWPKNSPDYREVNEEYTKHIRKLSEKIMGWLSEGLGLHREALKEGLGGETLEYMMKVIFYPPCPHLDLLYGAPPHTDLNGITCIIANDVHGLQAFKDNNWIDVTYDESVIIVIIADQITRMSNGKYKSGQHRATMDTERTRISWPVFAEPHLDHVVGTLPELTTGDDEKAPKFKPYVYREYKYCKLRRLPF